MSDKVSLLKVGGELLDEAHTQELEAIAGDIRALIDKGRKLILVHGGGPQTTALQKKLGQEPKIIGGRRVTDRATLDVLAMVVAGKLNIDFCSVLRKHGVNALGINGISGGAITCVRRPPKLVSGGGDEPVDLGEVGDIVGVNRALFAMLIEHGYTPLVASIGGDVSGRPYNINADMIASHIAAAYPAERMVMVTGTPGVLRDIKDPSSRIPKLTLAEARQAIANETVKGGMIVKLEETMTAIERGVAEVQILGRIAPGDLVRAFETPGSVGTTVVP